ncbi:MAG: aldose epimerase family protein [Bacteroidota bacterium]|nr:aldose epimerase family protein [Bacteroidota bacterium]
MSLILAAILPHIIGPFNKSDENDNAPAKKPGVTKSDWGLVDGKQVYLFTMVNAKDTEVSITNYGGIVTSFITDDKNGEKSSVIVGFDNLEPYLKNPPHLGSLVGRFGNRIAEAKFTLDGATYQLAANNGKNHLHGGLKGFDKVVWESTILPDGITGISLNYLSEDGEEGYPGNLNVTVQYSLTDEDELKIEYNATTDKATPVNLTNHSYFNLSGDLSNTIYDHKLMIAADSYTPVDSNLIPTGEIKPVKDTAFDFTTPKKIGRDIGLLEGGFDYNWVFNKNDSLLQKVAELSDSVSGRSLEVFTTEPALQFYTGNSLDGSFINRDGNPIKKHTALCLETQHFPDSPNQPGFPSTILRPGENYHSITIYKVKLN